MLPVVVIGASSLQNAMYRSISDFKMYGDSVIAEPGIGLNNLNPYKNVFHVVRKRFWRREQYILWHDAISNSISQHPTQSASPIHSTLLKADLRRLESLNVVAIRYSTRADSVFDLNLNLHEISVDIAKTQN